ncbi:MAG: hypothetical protein QM774_11055 [Gordonia sp. (in: high G+C Gram-positive bacteria)]|uniref:hypothetical protein n=1 Tax=Gordonia sp. (in: high G+C Gram-positive bacteria) TaxID=84139 RepID=UPI0039E6F780
MTQGSGREAAWSTATALVLIVRFLSTITTVLLAMMWLVHAVRESLFNGWLWWTLGSAALLIVSTYLYGVLRVRYPRHHHGRH